MAADARLSIRAQVQAERARGTGDRRRNEYRSLSIVPSKQVRRAVSTAKYLMQAILAIGPRCAIIIRGHTWTSAGFRKCPAERSRRSSRSADDIQQRLPPFILYDRYCALQRAGKRARIVHAFAVAAGGFANLFECRQFSQLNEVGFVAPGRQPFRIH